MAVIETAVLLTSKNESGEKRLIYPITRADCVDGLDELVDERVDTKSVSWNDLTDRPFGDNADGTVKQLDNKYLSILDYRAASHTEILSETSVEFTGGEGGPSDIAVLNNNEIYYVVWDGTEYVLTAHSVVFNGVDGIAVGNTSIIGAGDDTGEPFVLGYAPEHNLNVFVTQSPEDSTHTVRIYQSTEETFTLKDEYRPDVPHFNLAEMGLGDPTEDENVSMAFITTDTTQIFAAFEKGPVKFTITLDGSVQSHVMTGRYYISDNMWMAESVYNNDKVLYLAFLGDGIVCRCFSSESVLPDVGNSDNGKVLTVVGANWSAQELPAGLPEVTSEDNGKVLSVADGAWSAQDAPTSLPSVTVEDEGKVLTVKDGVWTVTEAPAGEGGSASTETDILSEQTLDGFEYDADDGAYAYHTSQGFLFLSAGETYHVVWDGVTYTCEATATSSSTCILGNSLAMGGEDNGIPFAIGCNDKGGASIYALDDSASHTIRIYQKKVESATVSWNDLTDRPFVDGQHIYIETGSVSLDTTVNMLDVTWVHATDTVISKGSLIGATLTAYFPSGDSQSVVVTEADIVTEYDGGIIILLLGAAPAWVCFRTGAHTITDQGTTMTVYVPKAGVYIPDYFLTELSAMEFSLQATQLDNKYLAILNGSPASEVIQESNLTFSAISGAEIAQWRLDTGALDVNVGSRYSCFWNNVEYTCVAVSNESLGSGAIVLGNLALIGAGDNTGEPFVFVTDGSSSAFGYTAAAGTYTVSICRQATYALKEEYLPMDAIETYLDNKGKLITVDHGSSGIWNYSKRSDGTVELWGVYSVSNKACTAALGGMYRTDAFQPDNFPFVVYSPKLVASYESLGYGAMLWATSETTTTRPPSYYLIRPTSGTITSGKIIFHVTGTWV